MATLNAGFAEARGDKLTKEDRDLIADFIATRGIETVQPAGADGNEATRGTRERIAQARRDFRKIQRNKNK